MTIKLQQIPLITLEQMKEVDRLACGKYRIKSTQLIENSGLRLAILIKTFLKNTVKDKKIVIAAGKGNKGRGGIFTAKILSQWGAKVTILHIHKDPDRHGRQFGAHLNDNSIEQLYGVSTLNYFLDNSAELVIDALIGSGLSGKPSGNAEKMINNLNSSQLPVISLDIPSGLHGTTGAVEGSSVIAYATLTLALPKIGLLLPEASKFVGRLYLADIGIPLSLYQELNLGVDSIFESQLILDLKDLTFFSEENKGLGNYNTNPLEKLCETRLSKDCIVLE
jgi:NAD(P)H-hydrate epimerase